MDDYYSLLGVDESAAREEIRAAYRDRKAALDASGGGKTEAAQLNKAWNVLSDPYQRGRYDEQRSRPVADGDAEPDDAPVEVQSNGRGRPPTRSPRDRQARPAPTPTITPPDGTRFPQTKQRVISMAIDLFVLLLVFVGVQFAASSFASSQQPKTADQIDLLNTKITQATKDHDAAKKASDAADKSNAPNKAQLDQATKDAQTNLTNLQKQHDDETAKLNGYFLGGLFVAFLLGFLYLVIPSALTGRTLGNRFQQLKVVRENGAPLGWRGAIVRYGLIVLVTMVLYAILRELAAVIVLVGVTTWMRNPNMQGMHDRIAHTIVVTDASE